MAEEESTPVQAEEEIGERSTDIPTSPEEEAATILSEVLSDIHRHTDVPVDTEHVVAQVATSPTTSDSTHSSDDSPL